MELFDNTDKLPVTDVLKNFLVLSVVLLSPHFDADQLLNIVNSAGCLLLQPIDALQLFVNCLVLALLYDNVRDIDREVVLSEIQKGANFIDPLANSIILLPEQIMRSSNNLN